MIVEIIYIILTHKIVKGTIAGLTYMDPLDFRPKKTVSKEEDPCKSLYWYPRPIPDYCFQNKIPPLITFIVPKPVEVGEISCPPSTPAPPPSAVPIPDVPLMFPPLSIPIPIPMVVPPPMMLPSPPIFSYGLVPPIPELVSEDGGINILPFSDIYSDLFQRNRGKQLNRRVQKQIGYFYSN